MPVPGIAADPPVGVLRLVDGWLRALLPAPAKYQGMSDVILWIRIRSDRQHFPGFGIGIRGLPDPNPVPEFIEPVFAKTSLKR